MEIVTDKHLSAVEKVLKARSVCRELQAPGVEFLEREFGVMRRKHYFIHWMFGLFNGQPDPSLAVELSVPPERIDFVKLKVIEFGERFRQEAVHITESIGRDWNDSAPEVLRFGESWQICWLAGLRELKDFSQVHVFARDEGVNFLSLNASGNQCSFTR